MSDPHIASSAVSEQNANGKRGLSESRDITVRHNIQFSRLYHMPPNTIKNNVRNARDFAETAGASKIRIKCSSGEQKVTVVGQQKFA